MVWEIGLIFLIDVSDGGDRINKCLIDVSGGENMINFLIEVSERGNKIHFSYICI